MVYTVTFNPSIDYVMKIEDFKEGGLNRSKDAYLMPGGKGINVSVVLNNLGIDTCMLGFVAGFTGVEIERFAKEMGCKTDFIHLENGMSRINVKLKSAKETEINAKGPEISDDALSTLYERLDSIGRGDALVLAGSVQTLPQTIYGDILKKVANRGILTAVDACGTLLLNTLIYSPTVIKPNHHELGEIFGVKIKNKNMAAEYAKKLQQMGAKNVLVSMGKEGAVLVCEDGNVYKGDAVGGRPVNTVGAGDSMLAGFLAEYLKTGDCERAFKLGLCAGGASACSDYLATKEAMDELSTLLAK